MKCALCGQDVPENAKYCPECGYRMSDPITGQYRNYIKYSEVNGHKEFESSFSDGAAGNVVAMFSSFLTGHNMPSINASVRHEEKENESDNNAIGMSENNDRNVLMPRLFKEQNGEIKLIEKRLKAKNKTDHQGRACLLYLLYRQEIGDATVLRDDLYDFMRNEKIYDGSVRSWLSRNSSLFLREKDYIGLSIEGEEMANSILSEVFDSSVVQSWKPGQQSPVSSVSGSKNTSSKNKQVAEIVQELNLAPSGKESLSSFLERHRFRKTATQYNLLFVYYLKQILNIQQVNQNHLFTCYRYLEAKLPNDLYHSISDTISKNNWMRNISNLELTSKGINMVEHEMRIK